MTYGTLNVDSVVNSDGVTSGGLYGFKNRIINGAMVIDQRNAGASVTPANQAYALDRWKNESTQASKFSIQQSTVAPAGFVNSMLVTSLSAYSVLSSDQFNIAQYIEGFNVADLGWGTANASSVTVSFWVRSSLTGVFGASLNNAAPTRSYPFSYTINAANTWEQKTVTIAGDTSGTWLTNNGVGIRLVFSLGCGSTRSGTANTWAGAEYYQPTGSTSIVGTSGATFYVTGVQLEKGSTATSFDYRPYGTEMDLCQRYYAKTFDYAIAPAQATNNTNGALQFITQSAQPWDAMWKLPVQMRTAPTLTTYSTNAASANWSTNVYTPTATIVNGGMGMAIIRASGSFTAGFAFSIHVAASAEL